MSAQITTLLAVCDKLLAHVGAIKNGDPATPAPRWVPVLNSLLDTRSILMKERDAVTNNTPTPNKKP